MLDELLFAVSEEVNQLNKYKVFKNLTGGQEKSQGPRDSRSAPDFWRVTLRLQLGVSLWLPMVLLLVFLPGKSLAMGHRSSDSSKCIDLVGADPKDSVAENSAQGAVEPRESMDHAVARGEKLDWEKELAGAVDGSWRPAQGSGAGVLFEALRANAPHMIKWLERNEKSKPVITQLLGVDAKGTVIGDFHILNIGFVELTDHQRKIGGIDIDDGGVAMNLFVDLFRGLVGLEVSQVGATAQEGFVSYLQGFNRETQKIYGAASEKNSLASAENAEKDIENEAEKKSEKADRKKQSSKPKFIIDLERLGAKDFDDLQVQWLKKIVKDGAFTEKAKVSKIHDSPKRVHELFDLVRDDLQAALDGKKILDHGYRSKTTGGSQGLPRFWYLVENPDSKSGLEVIEFKFQGRPASDLWVSQPRQTERVAAISRAYRPSEMPYGTYRVIETQGVSFLQRTRYRNFFEFDFELIHEPGQEEEMEKARQYYLYIMEWLGAHHRSQLPPISADSLNDTKAVAELFSLVDEYIVEMKKNQAEAQIAEVNK